MFLKKEENGQVVSVIECGSPIEGFSLIDESEYLNLKSELESIQPNLPEPEPEPISQDFLNQFQTAITQGLIYVENGQIVVNPE